MGIGGVVGIIFVMNTAIVNGTFATLMHEVRTARKTSQYLLAGFILRQMVFAAGVFGFLFGARLGCLSLGAALLGFVSVKSGTAGGAICFAAGFGGAVGYGV